MPSKVEKLFGNNNILVNKVVKRRHLHVKLDFKKQTYLPRKMFLIIFVSFCYTEMEVDFKFSERVTRYRKGNNVNRTIKTDPFCVNRLTARS